MSEQQKETKIRGRDLLRLRDFRFLWLGQIVSNFGDALTYLTLVLYINRLTGGDTQAIAWLLMALALPTATVGLVAGVFVDRWQRKRVMVISDILRGFLTLGLVIAVSTNQLWLIYLLAFCHASVGAFFAPARSAVIPLIVPKDGLLAANSLSQMSAVFFRVLGTAVAGVLVGTLAAFNVAFVIDAVTFFLSAFFISRILLTGKEQLEKGASPTVSAILAELKDGVLLIAGSRILLGILVAVSVTMLGLGSVNVLLAPFVVNDMGLPETWFGALEFAQSAAMILSGIFITALASRFKSTTLISAGLLVLGVVLAWFSRSSAMWQLFLVMFLMGLASTPINAGIATIMQTSVANDILGRVSAALHAVMNTMSLVSMFLAGSMAALIGVRNVFLVAGILVAVAGIASWWVFKGYRPPAEAGIDFPSPKVAEGTAS
jgi:DHA3 family macrolide efflux protein-like MFS transporter